MDCSHHAPLSMEFSRQEYWNGLPCPPPGHLPNPGIEPRSPALQVIFVFCFLFLPSESPGKAENPEVGSLSCLLGNFGAQELNQGLLHCRWIVYQLSYQSSLGTTGTFFQEGRSNESSKEPEPVPSTSGMSEISSSISYC